eukprot:sb/3464248/
MKITRSGWHYHQNTNNGIQQLCDLLHLNINTGTPVTIATILHSSSSSVTHVIANYLISHEQIQSFIDWGERCRNHSSDEQGDDGGGEDGGGDQEVHDDALSWLLNVLPWWPYQLDITTISVCLVECLIFKWSSDLDATAPSPDMSSLVSLSKVLLAVKSLSVQQSLLNVIWETVFRLKLNRIYSLVEKVGRQPKDRICQKEVGLDLESMALFVSIARHILTNINLSTPTHQDRTAIKQENVWTSEERQWLLHKVVDSRSQVINVECVFLHAQLLSSLELIISLSAKNTRPTDLFHSRHCSLLFTPFISPNLIKLSTSPDLESAREAMLRSSTKSSITTTFHPYETSWFSLIVNLSELWEISVPVQSYMSVLLYSLGRFREADEVVLTSQNRQPLGLQLLYVLLAQLEMAVFMDEESQKLFLPVLSPSVSSWLKSKRDPSVAMLEIGTVIKTLGNILSWMNDDREGNVRTAKSVRDAIISVL